jgi:serine/threonine protein kinase
MSSSLCPPPAAFSPASIASPRFRSGTFPPSRRDDDLVGAVVGGLEVRALLAEGGIGQVYAAEQPPIGARFALKVLRPEHADDPGMRSRFAREIAFGSRVCHPNVAAVRGSGALEGGRPFLVMDLLEGMTLTELVCQQSPLPIERALSLVDQILAGLAALHEARIVHRDLQPDNIFITRDSSGADRVLLLDLGFAHEPGVDTGDGVSPDSAGSLVGTIPFLAPEQVTRCRAITERSDLFVAGLVLYYTLTGELPFRATSDPDGLVALIRRAPIPLRHARRDAPRSLEAVLGRAFAKHPDARFGGALEMRDALRDAWSTR